MQKAIDALLAQKAEGDARVRALVEENDQLTERIDALQAGGAATTTDDHAALCGHFQSLCTHTHA